MSPIPCGLSGVRYAESAAHHKSIRELLWPGRDGLEGFAHANLVEAECAAGVDEQRVGCAEVKVGLHRARHRFGRAWGWVDIESESVVAAGELRFYHQQD